jgi:hypothetical protein
VGRHPSRHNEGVTRGDRGGHQESVKCGNTQNRYIVDLCHKITSAEFKTLYGRLGPLRDMI